MGDHRLVGGDDVAAARRARPRTLRAPTPDLAADQLDHRVARRLGRHPHRIVEPGDARKDRRRGRAPGRAPRRRRRGSAGRRARASSSACARSGAASPPPTVPSPATAMSNGGFKTPRLDGARAPRAPGPPAWKNACMLRAAWRMRWRFSTSAMRTWPSPYSPNPMPGETATLASAQQHLGEFERADMGEGRRDRRPGEHGGGRRRDVPAGMGERFRPARRGGGDRPRGPPRRNPAAR